MKSAFAEGTFKNLKNQWKLFLMFCFYYKLQPFPVTLDTLCLYAQFLSRSFCSVQCVKNYLSGVKTLHNILDLEYPVTNLFHLNYLIRGLTRIKQHVPNKALPITPEILKDFHRCLNPENTLDIVFWCLLLLMFFLMTRKSNMVPIAANKFDADKQVTRNDIIVREDMLVANIKWSKPRQFGHLNFIPITSIPDSVLCPVQACKTMISKVPTSRSDPCFCFYNKKSQSVPITYAQLQKKLRQLIIRSGRNPFYYSTHSMRRRGASFAFKSNVASELIQQHGDWISDCYMEYLMYDFNQKLSVSRKMCSHIQMNS